MDIKYELNSMKKETREHVDFLSMEEIQKARDFHKSFKEYEPTPLVSRYSGV